MYFSIQDAVSHGIAPIYTQLFLVKLKSVVDGPILHSKSVVDGSILHCKAKVCVFSVFMIVKLLIYHTGMCIKGPESWWIAKSITPQLVVNQSKINPKPNLAWKT